MTPIHPIGVTNRKGPNNTLMAGPERSGQPVRDRQRRRRPRGDRARARHARRLRALSAASPTTHGLELALDFAINVSPDHPWVSEHPEWFYHRPDGSIKYAENPPKKYEDIYPVNFRACNWQELWAALRDIILLWVRARRARRSA